ncbi:beta strand repeat-containing protein, partial [Microcoleus sp. D3_18_C4]|uniref:beta strand repeat-containing protein n=1 Tax=Microcoleus sp. D3_18_C4 TaxID=3055335 RepID=UPI003B09F0CB
PTTPTPTPTPTTPTPTPTPTTPTPTPTPTTPTPTPTPTTPTPTPTPTTPTDNQPPVAKNANSSLAPNSSQLVTGLGGSDPDGPIASYTINTLPSPDQAVLFLGDPANGGVPVTAGQVLTPQQLQQLFFQTTGNFTGANFTYSATDNSGATSPATATVAAILPTNNQPPVANNANSSLGPNSSQLVTGLGGSDPDGSIASYTINTLPSPDQAVLFLGDPANGGVPVTPGQVLTPQQLQQLFFQTKGNFTGANFTYSATDNSGASSPAVATVAAILRPVAPTPTPTPTPTNNQPPLANNANSRLGPNSSQLVTGLGGSDPDGSIASYTINTLPSPDQAVLFLGDPANGGQPVTPGQVLTPAQLQQLFFQTTGNFTGANFTYSATDNSGATSPATATVAAILPTNNQPPVANNANSSLEPNSSQLVTGLGGSDPDGSIASYTINTLPSPDQAVLFLGDPANGGVPVTPGQVLTPEQLQQLFFQTTGNFTGANFTYSATDNSGASSPAVATVAAILRPVSPIPTPTPTPTDNQPPLANNANSRLGPNSSRLVTGLGGSDPDPDGSIVSYTINTLPSPDQAVLFLGDPANGGVPVTQGQVLTPQQLQQLYFFTTGNFTGANFTYTATDNSGAISPVATASVAGLIGPTPTPTPTNNQPPVANNANSSLGPNSSRLVTGLGGSDPDPDGSIASYTINTLPPAAQGVLFLGDPANGGVPVTPGQILTPEQLGQLFFQSTGSFTGATFSYSATDSNGATSSLATATLGATGATPTPNPLNLPPVTNNANFTVEPNSSARVPGLGGSDPDGSIASYTINTLPPAAQGILFLGDPANGGVAVTPGQVLTPEQIGQLFFQSTGDFTGANFSYSATDNSGATSPATATVAAISPTSNQPPSINNVNFTVPTNGIVQVLGLGGSDPDGSIVSYTITRVPPANQGVLFLSDSVNGDIPVTVGQVLTPAQIGQLFFVATVDFNGATFSYTATDNLGKVSPASATVAAILRPVGTVPPLIPTPTPTPASPIISNPIAETDTNCQCSPIIEKPGINFAPPQQPPAVGFVRPISQFSEGQTTKGTDGDDLIVDTKGNQKIFGFEGNDLLLGEDGADEIYGNEDNDTIFGGIDTDIVYGDEGNDIVFAGKQNDWIAGDLGSDSLFGDLGADTILGDNGNDNSSSAQNNGDLIFGGNGADLINGNEGDDTIHTGKGDDIALGGKENDLIWGELGSDTLFGGIGSDSLFGGIRDQKASDSQGRDLLYGGFGNDFLNGQQGNDTLVAGKDNDRAYGGKGNDIIYGQLGSDTLYGGQGADTLLGDSGSSQSIGDIGEQDLIFADGGNDIIGGGHGNDTVQAGKGNDCVWGGKDHDLIWGELGSDTLVGDSGDDTMYGGARSRVQDVGGQDLLFGGIGADVLFGDEGDDTISGGEDNDLIYGGKANDLIHGDRGDDLIYGGDGSDEICGDEGNDTIYGDRADNRGVSVAANDQQDCINGGEGDDLLYGNEGQDTINGDAGSDTLIGGKDNDLLNGGAGDDWLFGDLGEDTLIGGIGSAQFVLNGEGGTDTVINFEVGVDKFVLTDGLSFQQLQFSATPNGTLLRVAGTDRVLANLVGVNGAIGSSDFLPNLSEL